MHAPNKNCVDHVCRYCRADRPVQQIAATLECACYEYSMFTAISIHIRQCILQQIGCLHWGRKDACDMSVLERGQHQVLPGTQQPMLQTPWDFCAIVLSNTRTRDPLLLHLCLHQPPCAAGTDRSCRRLHERYVGGGVRRTAPTHSKSSHDADSRLVACPVYLPQSLPAVSPAIRARCAWGNPVDETQRGAAANVECNGLSLPSLRGGGHRMEHHADTG